MIDRYTRDVLLRLKAAQESRRGDRHGVRTPWRPARQTPSLRAGGQDKIAELLEALPYSSALTDSRFQADPLVPSRGGATRIVRGEGSRR